MKCAIYARKSTQQEGDRDTLSVARQVTACRAYATARGLALADAHVYTDVESGAEFSRRPGLQRLLAAALAPTRPFDVLLLTSADRLGREQIENAFTLKRLTRAGVRVVVVDASTGAGTDVALTTPLDKVMASITAFAGEAEREAARSRTHAALLTRAQAGRVTGQGQFGYTNVCAQCGAPTVPHRTCGCKATVRRQVVEAEAAVVRAIFERA